MLLPQILSGQFDELRETYIGESVSTKSGGNVKRELLLKSGTAEEPKRQCVVCGMSKLLLKIDTINTAFRDMVNKVLAHNLHKYSLKELKSMLKSKIVSCGDAKFVLVS